MAVRDCVTAHRVAPQGNQAGREGIAHPSPADGVPPSGVTDLVLGSAPFACSRVRRLPVNAPLGTGQATVQLSLVNCQFGPRGARWPCPGMTCFACLSHYVRQMVLNSSARSLSGFCRN